MTRQRVSFPSFRVEEQIKPYDMRQLVAALEYRFQSLEDNNASIIPDTSFDDNLDAIYAPIIHTHVVADILDFHENVPSSIFDLTDVTGIPAVGQSLIWDGDEFVPGTAGGTLALGELTDVHIPAPADGEILAFIDANNRWEAVPAPSGASIDSLFDLTDTDLTTLPQQRYDLLFNADGTEWRNTGGKLIWDHDACFLQLKLDSSINWEDSTFTSQEFLALAGVSVPGPVLTDAWANNHATGLISVTSLTYVDVDSVNRVVDVSTLTDAADYFFYMTTSFDLSSSFPTGSFVAISDDGGTSVIPRSEGRGDLSGNAGYSWQFGYQTTISSAGNDIALQAKQTDASTIRVYNWNSFGLNVSNMAVGDYFYSETSTLTASGIEPTYVDTLASVTVGAGDYIVFSQGLFTSAAASLRHYIGVNDGTSITEYHNQEGANASNQHAVGGIHIFEGVTAGTTLTTAAAKETASGAMSYAMIAAFRIQGFVETYIDKTDVAKTDFVATGSYVVETRTFTAVNSGEFMVLGYYRSNPAASGDSGQGRIEVNINAAGAVEQGRADVIDMHLPNSATQCRPILPHSTFTVTAGDSVVVELILIAPPSPANWTVPTRGMVVFSLATNDSVTDLFIAGDPAFATKIDGTVLELEAQTRIDVPNAIGINWDDALGVNIELLTFFGDAPVAAASDWGTNLATDWTFVGITHDTAALNSTGITQDMVHGLDVFDVSDDGLQCIMGSNSDDDVRSYTLDTPFDFSNATSTGALNAITNPWYTTKWINSGTQYIVQVSTNTVNTYNSASPYVVDGTIAATNSVSNAALGFPTTGESAYWMSRDGTKFCGAGDAGSNADTLRMFDLSTPYDITTYTLASSQRYDVLANGPNFTLNDFRISEDGLTIICIRSPTLYLGVMTVPYDVTTLSFPSPGRNVQTDTGQGFQVMVYMTPDGNSMFVGRDTSTAPQISEYTKTVPNLPLTPERFVVGDPAYETKIDGTVLSLEAQTRIDVPNNIGINWDDVDGIPVEFLVFNSGVAILADDLWPTVMLLADMEGADGATSYTEVSDKVAVATLQNGASISNEQSHYGLTSAKLDGVNQYITFPNDADYFNGLTEDYTMEFWCYGTEVAPIARRWMLGAGNAITAGGWNILMNADNTISVRFNKNGSNNITINGSIVTGINQWHHVAVACDQTGTTSSTPTYLYIDGVPDGNATNTLGSYNNGGGLSIGGAPTTGEGYFEGYIDGVRLSGKAGSGVQVTRYPDGVAFTPSTASWPLEFDSVESTPAFHTFTVGDPAVATVIDGTVLSLEAQTRIDVPNNIGINWDDVSANLVELLMFGSFLTEVGDPDFAKVELLVPLSGANGSTTAVDLGPVGYPNPTFEDDAHISSVVTRFGENTLLLDGTADVVTWADQDNFSIPQDAGVDELGDFTVEVDVYWPVAPGTSTQAIVGKNSNTGAQREWLVRIDNNVLQLLISENGSGQTIDAQIAWTPVAETWYSVCMEVYRRGTGVDRGNLYVDGILLVSSATIATHPNNKQGTAPLRLGGWEDAGAIREPFTGHMANLRLSHGFARYKEVNYTPATGPYPTSFLGVFADKFAVGDPVFETVIDGTILSLEAQTRIDVPNQIGVNWDDLAGSPTELLIFDGGVTAGDDNIADVTLLLTAETAAAGATTIISDIGSHTFNKEVHGTGIAEVSIDQAKFGTRSMKTQYTSGSDFGVWVAPTTSNDFDFGAGDFTIEFFFYPAVQSGTQYPIRRGDPVGSDRSWWVTLGAGATIAQINFTYSTSGGDSVDLGAKTVSMPVGSWYHVVVCRNGVDLRYFIDGTQAGTTANIGTATIFNPASNAPLKMVNDSGISTWYVDDLRITKGFARYTANFIAPTATLPQQANSAERFIVGDPSFPTIIDGLTTNITSASTDIDGTLNVDGAVALQSSVSMAQKINANTTTVITTTHTAADEHVILVDDDTAAATVTVTLPAAATANTMYHIKKIGTTASVIIDGNASELIDGALTITLNRQYESVMLISNGTFWSII